MHANLDALVTALYVRVDDLLPRRQGPGRPPGSPMRSSSRWRSRRCSWACPTTVSFWRSRAGGRGTCSAICPSSRATTSGCAPWPPRSRGSSHTWRSARHRSATGSDCWTPRQCPAASRPRPRGVGARRLRRLRLVQKPHPLPLGLPALLPCASDGMPICFELAPANTPERAVAAEMLERIDLHGYTVHR